MEIRFSAPGAREHAGTGHPWITVQSQAAIPLKAPLSSGYRITESLTPVESRAPEMFGELPNAPLEVEP